MYTVTWNPGTFGHLLIQILGIEEHGQDVNQLLEKGDVNSHFKNGSNVNVKAIHPYKKDLLDQTHKIIKPYFKHPDLKFFQWYRNEVVYLKSDRHFKEDLRQYWNFEEPSCDTSYNIDMTDFFADKNNFCVRMAEFMDKTELLDDTVKFIDNKQKLNRVVYQSYLDNVVDTVKCLREKKHKKLQHLSNIEIGAVLCDFFSMDVIGTNNFCNNSPNEKPVSTTEILSYA